MSDAVLSGTSPKTRGIPSTWAPTLQSVDNAEYWYSTKFDGSDMVTAIAKHLGSDPQATRRYGPMTCGGIVRPTADQDDDFLVHRPTRSHPGATNIEFEYGKRATSQHTHHQQGLGVIMVQNVNVPSPVNIL
jgi:hypothetical protein